MIDIIVKRLQENRANELAKSKSKIFKKDGSLSMNGEYYVNKIKKLIDSGEKRIHTVESVFSRFNPYRELKDRTDIYKEVLDYLGYDYREGNDAPRGGKKGKYLEITGTK